MLLGPPTGLQAVCTRELACLPGVLAREDVWWSGSRLEFQAHLSEGDLKLQAMRSIVHPDALPLNVLAWSDGRCRADNRDQVAVTTDLDAQHAEAGLLTMEGHPLHGTSQLFGGMGEG